MSAVTTIDCHYMDRPELAAAYLIREGDEAAFIDTNTAHAVDRLLAALTDEGLTPEDVKYVIITHVHLDHAGGAPKLMELCPNATLLAHPKAAPHMIDPSKLVASAKQVYGEQRFIELYGELGAVDEARVRVMKDGEELAWGDRTLTFFYTRGHANHHFSIHDSASNSVFAGDSFGLIYPWLQADGLIAMISSSPTDFDAPAAIESVDKILSTGAQTVYLGHFGGHQGLAEIATQLRGQLGFYGDLVEHCFGSEMTQGEVDVYCEEQVREMFERRVFTRSGLTESHRQRLEIDISLNASGVAFAVKKKRFKAAKAAKS